MSLHSGLMQREAAGRPIRIGVIGAGRFGTMFLSQVQFTPGMQVAGVAELNPQKAKDACVSVGWPEEAITFGDSASAVNEGSKNGKIVLTENANDLMAIEAAGVFRGVYHVLQGAISPLDGVGPRELKIEELAQRLQQGGVDEVIVATNPTVEGDATSLYVARLIKPLGVRVTRIAQGIPAGGEIEYVDGKTMGRSLEGRREM